jgi:hypothetical protein
MTGAVFGLLAYPKEFFAFFSAGQRGGGSTIRVVQNLFFFSSSSVLLFRDRFVLLRGTLSLCLIVCRKNEQSWQILNETSSGTKKCFVVEQDEQPAQ